MYWLLAFIVVVVGTYVATRLCATGRVVLSEPDRTAEALRQDAEWMDRVSKLVEDEKDGQGAGSSRDDG